MKRILMLLGVAFCLMNSAVAQEHLYFRGVPISGKMDDFVSKMKSLGFAVKQAGDDMVVMEGRFTGKDAELLIMATQRTKTVWKVSVDISDAISWGSLRNSYLDYKALYGQKYGKGSSSELFSEPYYEGDGYELQALRDGRCQYVTSFKTATGVITVKLTEEHALRLSYEDSVNSELMITEKETSVLDEI